MSDRSAMHCELHRDYRCPKCFTVDGRDQSHQYVQGLESRVDAAHKEIDRLHYDKRKMIEREATLATEIEGLREALKLAREAVADNLQHVINSYGNCSLTRCIRVELAEIDRALAGQGGEG